MYYNSSDRPEDISSTGWRRREQKWNELLTGSSSLVNAGFVETKVINTLDILNEFELSYNILKDFSLEIRKKTYIKTKTLEYVMDKEMKKNPKKELQVSEYLKLSIKYKNGELDEERKIVESFLIFSLLFSIICVYLCNAFRS